MTVLPETVPHGMNGWVDLKERERNHFLRGLFLHFLIALSNWTDIFVTSIIKSAVTETRFNDPLAGTSAFPIFRGVKKSSYLKPFLFYGNFSGR